MTFFRHLSLFTLFSILSTSHSFTTPPQPHVAHLSSTALSAQRIAIAGATGRTGRHVVSKLLSQNIPVYALVRNPEKAVELFGAAENDDNLIVRRTDLGSAEDVERAMEEVNDCEAVIWCATGFSDAPDQSFWTKVGVCINDVISFSCFIIIFVPYFIAFANTPIHQ